jgi:DNA-binding GntR family transcriptional regulator
VTISGQFLKVRTASAPRTAGSTRKRRDTAAGTRSISSPDRIVESIVDGIRSGRYVPGQKLIEADLTDGLGVSRGPVREALKRLAAEGVVTLTLHRGAYLRVLTRAEVYETLVVLEVLTGLMARLAAETVNRGGHARQMREAFRWLAAYQAGEAGGMDQIKMRRHFYDALAEIGGNRQLGRIMPTMQIHLLRLQLQPYQTAEARRVQLRGYAEVADAVLAGNAQLAERAMRRHIRRTRARYEHIPDAAFARPKATSRGRHAQSRP